MTTYRQLSRSLRLTIAAPWIILAALAAFAGTPATRSLLLDAANKPVGTVSLSSSNWTGTLDAACLPALAPLLSGGTGTLNLSGYSVSLPVAAVTAAVGGAAINPASVGAATPGTGAFTSLTTSGTASVAYFNASGYANVYNAFNLLASYGHGVQLLPTAGDAGLTLNNVSDSLPATLTLGTVYADGLVYAAGVEVPSGVVYADTLAAGTALNGPGGFSASYTGLTMDFGAITTDGGGDLNIDGILYATGSIHADDGFYFADGSRLAVVGDHLIWTDAEGTEHTLASH